MGLISPIYNTTSMVNIVATERDESDTTTKDTFTEEIKPYT